MLLKKNYLRAVLVIAVLGVASFLLGARGGGSSPQLDVFAQCLTEKEFVMYGAEWCSHCQNEKRAFGSSFRLIPYVECPKDPKKCLSAGIDGYPTWLTPDGRRLEGEQGLKKLAAESGCPLAL
ncbi:hypothetical protein C4571_03300 [Candidatus Parcubacteria bacterium]|nr:MAG: hypothetical protein C4571_03300 [Candidatus Parcubacteria bacterium]